MDIRTGIGFDVHRFEQGRDLVLGGERIPYELGLLGHSDADVVLHSLCDALLGAAGLGDIGKHFPDTDQAYKGIQSTILLEKTRDLMVSEGFSILNVSIVIIAERPKLMQYKEKIRENIAGLLMLPEEKVNIAATTTETLGFVGRKEGIATLSNVLIIKESLIS